MLLIWKVLFNYLNFYKKKKKLVLFRYCNCVCVMFDRFDGFFFVLGFFVFLRGGFFDWMY